jgi:hypothetical protein
MHFLSSGGGVKDLDARGARKVFRHISMERFKVGIK